MILRILLIDMFIIAIFMYLLLLGASKCKTAEEIEMEDKEQMEQLKNNCNCRRQKNDK